jgi:hypothetical protein
MYNKLMLIISESKDRYEVIHTYNELIQNKKKYSLNQLNFATEIFNSRVYNLKNFDANLPFGKPVLFINGKLAEGQENIKLNYSNPPELAGLSISKAVDEKVLSEISELLKIKVIDINPIKKQSIFIRIKNLFKLWKDNISKKR